jgi:hypothetical protein
MTFFRREEEMGQNVISGIRSEGRHFPGLAEAGLVLISKNKECGN